MTNLAIRNIEDHVLMDILSIDQVRLEVAQTPSQARLVLGAGEDASADEHLADGAPVHGVAGVGGFWAECGVAGGGSGEGFEGGTGEDDELVEYLLAFLSEEIWEQVSHLSRYLK